MEVPFCAAVEPLRANHAQAAGASPEKVPKSHERFTKFTWWVGIQENVPKMGFIEANFWQLARKL
jgi:hypothetical protein